MVRSQAAPHDRAAGKNHFRSGGARRKGECAREGLIRATDRSFGRSVLEECDNQGTPTAQSRGRWHRRYHLPQNAARSPIPYACVASCKGAVR
jgi:hypothetical protein